MFLHKAGRWYRFLGLRGWKLTEDSMARASTRIFWARLFNGIGAAFGGDKLEDMGLVELVFRGVDIDGSRRSDARLSLAAKDI